MKPEEILSKSITLPNGSLLPNRLAKSAMSEALGSSDNRPTPALEKLYSRWAYGGIGLCITGNVMIDKRALGEPNNVAIEDESDLEILKLWANAGTQNNTELWIQLNHPGKQSPKGLNKETVAPSAVPFKKELSAFFSTPRALEENEIEDIIKRFGTSAMIAKKAGFKGVQIHGAHGYLVSQFLSPHHNQRTDKWGGNPENRQRFALEVLSEIRNNVGKEFPIGIKLNSSDFQKGGFTEEESIGVIQNLEKSGIDLIEISGGTYEAPAMTGNTARESTIRREAYFLQFAEKVRKSVRVPLMLTGGFRTLNAMGNAISSGAIDIVGLARPLAIEPDLPSRLLKGLESAHKMHNITTGINFIDKLGMLELTWHARQLQRMGRGENPNPNESAYSALLSGLFEMGWKTFKTRRLRA